MKQYRVTFYIAEGRNAIEKNDTVAANDPEEVAGYIYNLWERERGETIVDDILVYPPQMDEPVRFPH